MKYFSKIETLVVLATVALVFLFVAPKVSAQPYFTNSGTIYGAQSYNANLNTPLKPSATLSAQYGAGTLAGAIAPGSFPTASGFYTNSFSTNIFTSAPFVLVTPSLTNAMPAVVSVTTTNFVVQVLNTNATFYWEATGH
jgi:hypothetical protein